MAVKISKELVELSLAAKTNPGKRALEPLQKFAAEKGVPLTLLEDNKVSNDAEVHQKAGDLWQCIEGQVTFICGGKLIKPKHRTFTDGKENPDELYAQDIEGGTIYNLAAGDWLWIPPGEPHKHSTSGKARLFIVKVPVT